MNKKRKSLSKRFKQDFATKNGNTCAMCNKAGLISLSDVDKILQEEGLAMMVYGNGCKTVHYNQKHLPRKRELLSTTYHVDHIIPFSKGGHDSEGNFQLLCHDCNLNKSDKLTGGKSNEY